MKFTVQAACGSHVGKRRSNNEDNFLFDGKCLEEGNVGLRNPAVLEEPLVNGTTFAVFDGMGGQNYGELASYAAARQMQATQRNYTDFVIPERDYLKRLTAQLNDAVLEAQQQMHTTKMGTTVVCLYFSNKHVYVCNVGDSRAYRLRKCEFLQLSKDHVGKRPPAEGKKPPLTQYLGIAAEDMVIEPFIAKGDLQEGDVYLLCSDGVTDMLTHLEISNILTEYADPEDCVQHLIDTALERGGKDNITAIVCKLI